MTKYSDNTQKVNPFPASSMLDAALNLIARNINPVPVAYPSENSRGKNPTAGEGWQNVVITPETAPQYFANGKINLGGMMGALSNGSTDVDCDCVVAIRAAPYLLPPTDMLFGRPSTPGAHWLYVTSLSNTIDKAAIAYDDPVAKKERKQCRIVELRIGGGGKGAQTVFPPSKHESGEFVTWEKNGNPAVVDGESLQKRVAALAACSLIARYWPGQGVRQDAALALGGVLSRAGKQPQAIKLMAEAIAKAANDEEWKQRVEAALTSDKSVRDGDKKVFGLPKLGECIGVEIASTAAEWLGYRESASAFASPSANTTAPSFSPDEWPEPTPLPDGLSPVPAMDPLMLPDALVPWLQDISDRMQVPLDFVGVPAMTAIGSIVGCKIGIRPKQFDDWVEVPNFWSAIIARPGMMKSPSVAAIMAPVHHLQGIATAAHEGLAKEHELDAEIYKKKRSVAAGKGQRIDDPEPVEPVWRRYFTNDSSYEKLCEILRDNPTGVLLHRDEIVSLLRFLDQEQNSQARGFYMAAWGGKDPYNSDRIGRGAIHVERACVSVLGTAQPSMIGEYVRRAVSGGRGDDGMIQRFMVAWPDTSPDWKNEDRYLLVGPRDQAWQKFSDLDTATPASLGAEQGPYDRIPFLRFTPEAQAEFEPWRQRLESKVRGGDLHPSIESHIAKYRGLIPKLALITHLIDNGGGPVDRASMLKALMWCEYLEAHALRLYGAGVEPGRAVARTILSRLQDGAIEDRFTARDIYRRGWPGLDSPDHVLLGLNVLCDHDGIAPVDVETGGRHRTDYLVNPRGKS